MSHGAKAATAQHVRPFTSAKAGRPLWMRGINAAARLAPRWLEPSAEAWWAEAHKKEPDAGEPAPEAVAALDALVRSINEDAALNLMGRFSAKDDTVRMARTHLRIQRTLRERPEILDHPIPPPLFIVGWPPTPK